VHLALEWRAGTKQRHLAPWFLRLQNLSHRPCCSTLNDFNSDVDIDNGHIFNLDNDRICNTDANVDLNHSHVTNSDTDVDNIDNNDPGPHEPFRGDNSAAKHVDDDDDNDAGPDELFRGDKSAAKHVDDDDDNDAGPDELFRGDKSAAKHVDDDDDNDAGPDELRRGDISAAKHVDDDAVDDGANDHSTDDEHARGWCTRLGGPVESSAGVIEHRWPFRGCTVRAYFKGSRPLTGCILVGPCSLSSCASRPCVSVNTEMISAVAQPLLVQATQ